MIVGEYYTLSEGGFRPPPPHTTNTVLKERDLGVSIRWRVTAGAIDIVQMTVISSYVEI